MFQTNDVEEIKTHILCPMIFFAENRAVYEITRKIVVQPDRPQMTIQYGACSLEEVKNTHIHSEHSNLTLFSTTIVTRMRFNVTFHIHCLSCLISREALKSRSIKRLTV